jgi:hypothetical protein
MQIALVCEKCGKIHTEESKEGVLVVDFSKKHMSFICQNKQCKYDNIFSFDNWKDKITHSPLPQIRITR